MKLAGINKAPADTKVVVAMSGGVDSSTVAALMKEAGYNVVGITLQLYDFGAAFAKKGACCAGQDIHDARRVAEKLEIPHYVLNYENLFKDAVMEEFADSYLKGETPIPCVKCNQSVKFRDLLGVAKDLDADALVTGHYVRRFGEPEKAELHRAVNFDKDQSYFLFATTKEQLSYLHFPLGGMSKDETRQHAQRFGLPVADKPDSQDICFVPGGDYVKVIEKLRPGALDGGDIVHIDGTVLGKHEGIIHYTIGQRRGIGIGGTEAPLYVVKLDAEKKQVIVGPESALGTTKFSVREMNWLAHEPIAKEGRKVGVKLRSASQPSPATVFPARADGWHEVVLDEPQKAVTPGQACVMYDGTHVLGGGWITREHKQ